MNYKTCTMDEMVDHMFSVSRQRIGQKYNLAVERGDTELADKITRGRLLLRDKIRVSKNKLIRGVGVYSLVDKLNHPRLFIIWQSMLSRCYGKLQKVRNIYAGVTVGDDFKDFPTFVLWCKKQPGYGHEDFDVDKDLRSEGTPVYSEATCSLIPQEINVAIAKRNDKNGLPTGVTSHINGSFIAKHCNKHIGCYSSIAEAADAYKSVKESHVRGLADKYKEMLSDEAYLALKMYTLHVSMSEY
jgi:hypothetical protein